MKKNENSKGIKTLLIIAVVILFFIYNSATYLNVIILIIAICILYSMYHNPNGKPVDLATDELMTNIYTKEIMALISQCYNKTTHEFDWSLYWHEYNDFWDDNPKAKAFLRSQLRSVSKDQIHYIVYRLNPAYPDEAKRTIDSLSFSIISNIDALAGGGARTAAPANISAFCNMLKDIKMSQIPCTREAIMQLLKYTENLDY